DDDHGSAAGTEIFLRAGEDEAEFLYLDALRSDVRGHVGHQRNAVGFWHRVVLRAFDGVVGAQVHVAGVGRQLDVTLGGHTSKFLRLGGGSDVVGDAFFQFAESFLSPSAGVQNIHGFTGQAKVHGHHGKLHAAAALQEQDGILVGNGQVFEEAGFSGGDDAF